MAKEKINTEDTTTVAATSMNTLVYIDFKDDTSFLFDFSSYFGNMTEQVTSILQVLGLVVIFLGVSGIVVTIRKIRETRQKETSCSLR